VELKDRLSFLTSAEQVDDFIDRNPLAVIFKAGTCHKTSETFARVQPLLEGRNDLPVGVIRVVEARPASNHVVQRTGVRHESPQILVFKDGNLVMDRSQWDISQESLAAALDGRLAAV
jgi:bacillithiol system protein YtxJ